MLSGMTIRDILDEWPSVGELADDMDVPVNTAKKWRSRQSLPVQYWDRLLRAAEHRGYSVTAEQLVEASKKAA